ncbi:SNase-domain-containing protein [Testicularia cyperi]|uniref:SNase-domain-containing protein n=1 Tax=Testicularia cyperi TaxID=1882483 RepID=A0A317XX41_9BASI|nr:SNase-domain-containing protein [Testicularia cyperi]
MFGLWRGSSSDSVRQTTPTASTSTSSPPNTRALDGRTRADPTETIATMESNTHPDALVRRPITVRSVLEQSTGVLSTIVLNPIGAAVTGVTVTGVSALLWWRYFRRIPTAEYMTPAVLKYRKVLVGRVVNVGDADGFRFHHTPGPPLLRDWLWPWPPRSPKTKGRRVLVKETISVRLAGVDAPESGHFGKPAQPFSQEAKQFLVQTVHPDTQPGELANKTVWLYPSHVDQYKRLVATPYVWHFPYVLGKSNVSLMMVQKGLATVYRAAGADYGQATWWAKLWRKSTTGFSALERAETKAKRQRTGMWSQGKKFESPEEYKRRHKIDG